MVSKAFGKAVSNGATNEVSEDTHHSSWGGSGTRLEPGQLLTVSAKVESPAPPGNVLVSF